MKKETVTTFNQYGRWIKSTRNVHDFSPGKTLFEIVVTTVVWGGVFVTIGALVIGLLWLFGG